MIWKTYCRFFTVNFDTVVLTVEIGPKPCLNTEEEQETSSSHLLKASSMEYDKTRHDACSIVEQYG